MCPEWPQKLVTAGPKDERIQSWVDDYYRRQKAGETAEATTPAAPSFPPVSACLPCHEPAVSAWRKHSHARAVETLEQAGRDVAACLRCHDERLRRDGLRPAAEGDRGVVCATCHEDLPAHRAATETKPTTMAPAGCLTCHDREHSPRWAADTYLSAVAAACRAAAR